MRNLEAGNRVKVLLDPLSHGSNMLSCLVEYEVIRVDDATIGDESDQEMDVSIAIVKISSASTTEWGKANEPKDDDGSWKPEELVGELATLIRSDGDWHHTGVGTGTVDFVEEEVEPGIYPEDLTDTIIQRADDGK